MAQRMQCSLPVSVRQPAKEFLVAVIDQWHPLCRVQEVTGSPVGVVIDGHSIAVFRTVSGHYGVLNDACPHRRMRLSKGKVCGERLECC
jgi:phenylpropionate dioxygenase-like ring-hydroxylating dioxygenase large terminal subunit